MVPPREECVALLKEYTSTDSLLKHAYAVEAAMRYYAKHEADADEHLWAMTGLLHDFDYVKYPTAEEHPYVGTKILKERGFPDEMVQAILGHATYTGVSRETRLAQTLFASDELTGLITAAVLVRPDKNIHELEVKSVKKKFKDKAFARGVNRDDVRLGCEELGIPLDEHMQNCINAMKEVAADLGLQGNA